MQNVTEMTANAESLEAVHMHAKRKASDDQSDVKQKYLKGKIGFNSGSVFRELIHVQHSNSD